MVVLPLAARAVRAGRGRLKHERATPRDEGFGNGRFVRNVFESGIVRQAWRLRDVTDPDVDQLRELRAEDLVEVPDVPVPDVPVPPS